MPEDRQRLGGGPYEAQVHLSPSAQFQRSALVFGRLFLLGVLIIVLAFWSATLAGCKAPDRKLAEAIVIYHDGLAQEYWANLEAGQIRRLQDDGSLADVPIQQEDAAVDGQEDPEELLARRRRERRAWGAARDQAAKFLELPAAVTGTATAGGTR